MSLRLRDPYDLMYGSSVKEEEKTEIGMDQDQETAGIIKKKRRPAVLCIECPVCGGPAPDHVHFGGQCCYSCRAFFRRSSSRPVSSFRCRSGKNDCIITSGIKSCIPCRLAKCLKIGMDPNLVRGKKFKKEKFEIEDEDGEYENDEMMPPPLAPVETKVIIEHRNLLKYRADILKYQGMCLQYQASLLEREASQFSSPPGDFQIQHHQGFPLELYDTKGDQVRQNMFDKRERSEEVESKFCVYPGETAREGPLDLTIRATPTPRLHTQSEHMPRIFFSKISNTKP